MPQFFQKLFLNEGLSYVGLVDLGPEPDFVYFEQWIAEGRQGAMSFLSKYKEIRRDPSQIFEGARQAVLFALPYFQGDKLNAVLKGKFQVAQYARMRDYHKTMKQKAEKVLEQIQQTYPDLRGKIAIDSSPILERALASRSGSGFIGKNTCFIDPIRGSFLLLGEIIINMRIMEPEKSKEPDLKVRVRTENGGCGTCRRCQVFCPTGALDQDYRIDARKCLAYWTIEHRGLIPTEFWPWIKTYIFGCDICQLACPYNRASQMTTEIRRNDFDEINIFDVATMSQSYYERVFGGTPLTRAKRIGLRRNALIALAVSNHPGLARAMEYVGEHEEILVGTRQQITDWLKKQEK